MREMMMQNDSNILWYSFDKAPSIQLFPLADVHLGAEGADFQAFYGLVNEIAKEPNAYVTLQGDLIDNGIKNSVTNCYRATMRPSEQKREMAKALEPIRDKILCILPGNHERRSGKETDDDPAYDIASKLDLEDRYRESIAFLRVGVGNDRRHDRAWAYHIACVHGAGGGGLAGTGVSRADNYLQSMDGVDILIHAHNHKPYAYRGSKLVIDIQNRQVKQRPYLTMCTGGWLQYVGYPVDKMMRSVAMPGANKLLLSGERFRFEAIV
jgi:predicted phosphodiesterase